MVRNNQPHPPVPQFFSSKIKAALQTVGKVLKTKFHAKVTYETVNLDNTKPVNGRRHYKTEFKKIKNKKGLYLFYETTTEKVTKIFYVGKTGQNDSNDESCDVFYKAKSDDNDDKDTSKNSGGSGRITHHIVGKDDTIFADASGFKRKTDEYNDFVNKYSVLCMIIDSEQIGDRFEKLLLLCEAYLILALTPKMNKALEFDMRVIRSSTKKIQKRLTSVITELLPEFV